jgi:histidinol-phosphate/aromatic aminotransferase/cobyric acid decarboxylase-like protein
MALDAPDATWVIVDLTYEDYMMAHARARQAAWVRARLESGRPTVAVKSLAKSLPIAGFRFGLLATNVPEVAAHFTHVYNRKLVTEAAFHVVQHGLDHHAFYAGERASIFESRSELRRALGEVAAAHGVRLETPAGGNFIIGCGDEPDVQALAATLAHVGIAARVKAKPGDGALLRLTSVAASHLPEVLARLEVATRGLKPTVLRLAGSLKASRGGGVAMAGRAE